MANAIASKDSRCLSEHPFPFINEQEIATLILSVARKSYNEYINGNASPFVLRYSLSLLLELIRSERLSNTCRDFLTTFDCDYHPEFKSPLIEELCSQKVFTFALIMIDDELSLGVQNTEITTFAQRHFDSRAMRLIENSVTIALMPEPLHSLPYCRSSISGKYVPRLIATNSGNVYDYFGVRVRCLSYDKLQHQLTYTFDGTSIKLNVPCMSVTKASEKKLLSMLSDCVSFSFLYGHFSCNVEISKSLDDAFCRAWNVASSKDPLTNVCSLQPTLSLKFNEAVKSDANEDEKIKFTFFYENCSKQCDLFYAIQPQLKLYTTALFLK